MTHHTDKQLAAISAQQDAGVPANKIVVPADGRKKRKNPEMKLHMACVKWWASACLAFRVPEFLLWHTQNGMMHAGTASDRERIGGMMKRMAVRPGVPDLFLAAPASGWLGLFVELKAPKGVLSDEQKVMLPELQSRGYQTAVCRTLEDFKAVVTNYLK